MYDRIEPNSVLSFDDMERAQGMMKQFNPDSVVKDIRAAVSAVDQGNGVSLLGFCWGGGAAARMASILDLAGAISYYGTRLAENAANGANCATLFHFGDSDQHSSPEITAGVKRDIPDAECYVYDAGHAFANDARADFYVEGASKLARQRSLDFLNRVHRV